MIRQQGNEYPYTQYEGRRERMRMRMRERERNTPKEIKYNNRMVFLVLLFVEVVQNKKKKSCFQLVIIDR